MTDAAVAPTTLANGVFSVNSGVSSRLSWKLWVFSVSSPPSPSAGNRPSLQNVVELKQWGADIICLYSMDV